MPKESREQGDKNIDVKVSKCEYEFLNFTRGVKYAEFKLVIMNGEPVKAFKPIQSIRFDMKGGEGLDKPISN